MPGATKFDRILIVAIGALLALFMFGTVSAMVTSASADDASGKRNDDAVEIEVVEEDDDADPLARGDDDSGGDDSGANSGSRNSGSRSIGSHSANTATGTTNNTGVSKTVSNSKDASKNTGTGTTRGTGGSKSVSNTS
jgi:hypothetical protein